MARSRPKSKRDVIGGDRCATLGDLTEQRHRAKRLRRFERRRRSGGGRDLDGEAGRIGEVAERFKVDLGAVRHVEVSAGARALTYDARAADGEPHTREPEKLAQLLPGRLVVASVCGPLRRLLLARQGRQLAGFVEPCVEVDAHVGVVGGEDEAEAIGRLMRLERLLKSAHDELSVVLAWRAGSSAR